MKTKVLFRKWPNGQIIALFPEIPAETNGIYSSSYELIGEHGAADAEGLISRTSPALAAEYAETAIVLTRREYDLTVITRIPRNAYQTRRLVLSEQLSA